MDSIVSLLVFGATFALVMGVSAFLKPRIAGRRLAKLGAAGAAPEDSHESLLVAGQQNPLLRLIGRLGQHSVGTEEAGPLRRRLVHAGIRSPAAPAIFYGLRIVLALGVPSVLLSLPFAWRLPHLHLVLLLCLSAGFGFVAARTHPPGGRP